MPEPGHTGLYVYGVTPSTGSLPSGHLRGMDDAAVELITVDELGAVVTEISLPRPPGRRRDLLSHSDILNAIAREQDVVPLRFGTIVPDGHAVVHDLLTARSDSLRKLLDRLTGAVQLNLKASYVEERVLTEVVQASREIRDLRERTRDLPEGVPHPDALRLGRLVSLALDDRRHEDGARLADSVLPLVRDSRVRERATPDHVLDIALLVDRESVPLVEGELERVAADVHGRIRLQLTGPLAAYDFVEDESWD